MSNKGHRAATSNFRQFFLRGLGILLPTILTIWILVAVYQFVDQKIADPINRGVQELVIRFTPWPAVTPRDVRDASNTLTPEELREWKAVGNDTNWLERHAQRIALRKWWQRVSIGNWAVLDLIGLLIAIILIYTVGLLLGGFLGRRIYVQVENRLKQLPGFRQVYPYVKQVTDFLVGDGSEKLSFNKVVAVEYPRKGIWSVGLVTGDTMRVIEQRAGRACITVFVPSSPTPFTGYVITVPIEDTIELPISIDEALRFTVSGGVIVPPNQVIVRNPPPALPASDQTGFGAGARSG